jgi:hypothetical protein
MPHQCFNMDNNLIADYSDWTAGKEYPEWMDEISLATISKGYLLPGETVKNSIQKSSKCISIKIKKT